MENGGNRERIGEVHDTSQSTWSCELFLEWYLKLINLFLAVDIGKIS